ncbi:MAG: TRAP transporter small permease subunit [Rhodospirillales bacterium]|nr:TRAP transporter small permease subunit [Rhodospirillales bacterium]
MLARAAVLFERLLEAILIFLMVALTAVVVVAVVFRMAGDSLVWYDEVASIMLAWVTYYGGALAALKRGHIGFDGLVIALPPAWRGGFVILAELCVFGFFLLLAWTGWVVIRVLEGDTLVSLPGVSVQFTQSVIPVGASLFLLAEALSLPAHWRRVMAGVSHDELVAAEPGDPDSQERTP